MAKKESIRRTVFLFFTSDCWHAGRPRGPPGRSEWQQFTRIFSVQLRDIVPTAGVKDRILQRADDPPPSSLGNMFSILPLAFPLQRYYSQAVVEQLKSVLKRLKLRLMIS